MVKQYPATVEATKRVGLLCGLLAFVLVAGFCLTGSPTAGVGALAGVGVFVSGTYVCYRLVGYCWYGEGR